MTNWPVSESEIQYNFSLSLYSSNPNAYLELFCHYLNNRERKKRHIDSWCDISILAAVQFGESKKQKNYEDSSIGSCFFLRIHHSWLKMISLTDLSSSLTRNSRLGITNVCLTYTKQCY